jgi:DNA invertase Pin-like site-specific DNA recombinase
MANQYSSELNEQRKIATKLLSRGQVTVAEIASYYGLARQTVQRWADGIDVAAVRKAWIGRKVDQASK